MNAKKREQFVQMALPAAVVLTVYMLLVNLPQQRAYQAERERLDAARKTAVTEQDVLTTKVKLEITQNHLREVTTQVDSERSAIKAMLGTLGSDDVQFAVLERITQLLDKHRVLLISQATAEQLDVSDLRKQALSQIQARRDGRELQYRKFTLQGRYANVLAFLDEVGKTETDAIPLAVQLDTSEDDGGMHDWELVIAM